MAKGSSITIKFIRTVEFGLALGCIWGAWTAGGDMFLVAPALIAGLVFAIIGIGTIPDISKRSKLWSVGVVSLIYFGIGAFLYWHFQPKVEAATKQSDSNAAILLDCRPTQDQIRTRPFAEVLVMYMNDGDAAAGGGGPIGFGGNVKADKDGLFVPLPDRSNVPTWRCQLTNFEDFVIFQIAFAFKIKFQNIIKTESGTKSGDLVSAREWPVALDYINPKSTIIFYAFGMNQKYIATAELPQFAQYMKGGDDTRLIAKLRPPGFTAMWFYPMVPKN
jgi:hypothetical protein